MRKVLPECTECLRLRATNCPIGQILFIIFYNFFTIRYVTSSVVVCMHLLTELFAIWVLADERHALTEAHVSTPRAGLACVCWANLLYSNTIFRSLIDYHVLQFVVRPVAQHELFALVSISVVVFAKARKVFHVNGSSLRLKSKVYYFATEQMVLRMYPVVLGLTQPFQWLQFFARPRPPSVVFSRCSDL